MSRLKDTTVDAELIARTKRRFDFFLPNYLLPLLRREDRIVSVGCGLGQDVRMLHELGYDVRGLDPGSRTTAWGAHPPEVAERLRVAFADDLPFGTEAFDFAYSLEVIEHVGCEDGIWKLLPDAWETRRRFLESCLAMLRPGGRLLLSTSNRLCPLDVGHAHHYAAFPDWAARRLGVNLTVPWDRRNFVWSFGDVVRCVGETRFAKGCRVDALSTARYPSRSRSTSPVRGLVRSALDASLHVINTGPLRTSFLNPLLVVMVTRDGTKSANG
ncbi:methyltransferase domain-containing protein [bacterium]|nr:methyltransferase domain-containing protein [bacterium]